MSILRQTITNNNTSLQKAVWIFGGIAGVLSAVIEYLYYTGTDLNSKTMFMAKIVVLAICVVFGLILIKKLQGGVISIGRTLFSGVLIAFVRSIITSAVFIVLYLPNGEFYQPHLDKAMAQSEQKVMENDEIAEEDKAQSIKDLQDRVAVNFTPSGYAFFSLLGSIVTAFVVSILMAAFIAKNMMFKDLEPRENG